MYKITDIAGTDGSTTVEHRWQIVDAIRPWYPEAPADVTEALDGLDTALARHEPTDAFEEFLAITIESE